MSFQYFPAIHIGNGVVLQAVPARVQHNGLFAKYGKFPIHYFFGHLNQMGVGFLQSSNTTHLAIYYNAVVSVDQTPFRRQLNCFQGDPDSSKRLFGDPVQEACLGRRIERWFAGCV